MADKPVIFVVTEGVARKFTNAISSLLVFKY